MANASSDVIESQTIQLLSELGLPADVDPGGATISISANAIAREVQQTYRENGRADEYDASKVRQAVAGGLVAGVIEPGDKRTADMVAAVRDTKRSQALAAVNADFDHGNINRETFVEARKMLGVPVAPEPEPVNPFYPEF